MENKNQQLFEFFLCLIFFWILFAYFVPNLINTYGPSFLLYRIKVEEIRPFILGIWQIQVTLSLVIFTVISLMISRIDEKYYGVSIKDFVLSDKEISHIVNPISKSSSLYYSILVSLILIIFNFINFYRENIDGSVAILILNLYILFVLVSKTVPIVLKSYDIRKMIRESYIYQVKSMINNEKYDNTYNLMNLKNQLISLVVYKNNMELEDNLNFLYEILNLEFEVTNKDFEKKMNTLIKDLTNCFIKEKKYIIHKKFIVNLIRTLYCKYKLPTSVSYSLRELIDKARFEILYSDFIDLDFFDLIYNDIGNKYLGNEKFILEYFNLYVIYTRSVLNSDKLNDTEKVKLIDRMIHTLAMIRLLEETKLDLNKKALLQVIRTIFKHGSKYLKKYLFESFIRNLVIDSRMDSNNSYSNHYELIVVVTCFTYYAGYIESLNENLRNEYQSLISDDITVDEFNVISIMNKIRDEVGNNIWLYYSITLNILDNGWNFSEIGKVKWVPMRSAVNQFFIFYSEANIDSRIDFSQYKNISWSNLINLIKHYYDYNGNIDKSKHKDYAKFRELMELGLETEFKVSNIYHSISNRVKEIELEISKKLIENEDKIKDNIDIIKKAIQDEISSYKFYDSSLNTSSKSGIQFNLATDTIIDYSEDSYKYISIMNELHKIVNKMLDDVRSLPNKLNLLSSEKPICDLNNILSSLKSKSRVPDTIVGISLTSNNTFYKNSTELELDILKNIDNKLNNIELPFSYPMLITYSNEFYMKLNVDSITIKQYTDEEIEEVIRDLVPYADSEQYIIEIYRDVNLIMSKEEAFKYYKNIRFNCNIIVSHEITIPEDSVGLLYEIRK